MPYDLDAVKAEVNREPFEFTFGGEKFTLPASMDILAVAALEGGKLYEGLRQLLGSEQWERLFEMDAVLTTDHVAALMQAYGEHLGVAVGE